MTPDSPTPFLLRNLKSKLIAFLLALVTWYVVHGAISHEYELVNVPVTVSLTPGWAVLERSAESVSIRFRGSREDIRELNSEDVQVIMDLRGAEQQGEREIILQPQDVKAPGNARPLSFRPSSLVFTLDVEEEKIVAVKSDLVGELPPGIEMESLKTEPATVRLVGPKTLLAAVKEVRTQPLDLNTRLVSFEERVDIVPPELGGEIRVDPRKVTVGMKLIQRSAQLDVQELPVRALFRTGVSPQISFDPGVVDVILSGQPEVLNKVQKQSILAYVDCSSIGVAGEYELPVRIDVPPRVSVSEVKPAVIKVRVENL